MGSLSSELLGGMHPAFQHNSFSLESFELHI